MAITTVNARYEGFIFDGQNSRNYGVYVTDVEVFGAPVRNVEMIQIPGRNGAYALDNGFYENIQVTYKCAMGCESQADFNAGISAFRNMLASRIGYKRLEDEINSDEYRMACFHGGISVPTLNKDTATFDVVFDCKPQRFLKSGENPRTIGGDVTNTKTETGSIVTIEGTGADKVTSIIAQIEPVQAGSGAPSPTNVRAITGWTAANVSVAGKNLLRINNRTQSSYGVTFISNNGVVSASGTATAAVNFFCEIIAPATGNYYFGGAPSGYGGKVDIFVWDNAANARAKKWDGTTNSVSDFGETMNNEVRLEKGKHYYVTCRVYKDATINDVFRPMLRLASETDDTYEPYKGHTVTVSFGDAGTVYGGTLDVVTGVLTVTHAMVDLGSLTWNAATVGGAPYFLSTPVSGGKIVGGGQSSAICEMYATYTGDLTQFSRADAVVCVAPSAFSSATARIGVRDTRYTDAASFKSAVSGVKLVYELATQQTYNLTAQQVGLLTGNNNVWADTGDATITWGDDPNKLVNPTLYNAHPLLSFTASGNGSGNIIINNNTISVTNKPIGDIVLANVVKLESGKYVNWQDTSRYLSGDAIRIESIPAVQTTVMMDSYSYANYTSYRSDDMDYLSTISTPRGMLITHSIPNPPQFVAGTTKSVIYTATVIEKVKEKTTGEIVDNTLDITVQITYDGLNRITVTNTVTSSLGTATTAVTLNTITVNSTKQSLVGTAYIDLDIGEAYAIDRGAVVSINDSVSIGASLPVLKPGVNIISKTGAVENPKVTPRWWQL